MKTKPSIKSLPKTSEKAASPSPSRKGLTLVVKDGQTGELRFPKEGEESLALPLRKVLISPGVDITLLGQIASKGTGKAVVRVSKARKNV